MIQIGVANGLHLSMPIITFLKSTEDGLRYCRSIYPTHVAKGDTDIAPWGTTLHGEISDDAKWMVGTLISKGSSEAMVPHIAETFGVFPPRDIDIPLPADLGDAIPGGARAHVQLPVPASTAGSLSPGGQRHASTVTSNPQSSSPSISV